MERDITMKRHLIEDLKFRQKVNLESNESINEMLENLEKKVSAFMFSDVEKKSLPSYLLILLSINLNKFIENIHKICILLHNYVTCSESTLF